MSQEPAKTICPYCGVGCGIELEPTENGSDVNLSGWQDNPVNEGALCIKGMSADDIVTHEDRLTTPLIKEDGEFREASWDEAIDRVVSEMERITDEHGADALGFFASSQLTNEENYVYQKLARQLGTNNVDNCARLCHASTVVALGEGFGMGAMTNSMEDLEESSDVYWIQGSNPAENHPVAYNNYFKQAASDGTFVIQVDPHENKLSRDADLHIQHKPGTDIPLLNAVLKTILEEDLYDEEFIESRTEGFEELQERLADFDKEEAAEIAEVDLEDIETAARKFAEASNGAIFTGMGMSQHRCGVDNVQNLINLSLATGQVGRPGTGVNPLRGQNNVQGASDVGGLPSVLPGYRPVDDKEEREAVEEIWGFEIPEEPGLTHVEVAHGAGEDVFGAYVLGENPVRSEPNSDRIEEGFNEMEFVVAQDIFMTETAELADVVLPATSWAESHGTVTNTDRRVQLMRPATKVHENTRQDFDILVEIGSRLFDSGWDYDSPEDAFEELREVAPIYRGITWDRIGEEGVQWPCYSEEDEGELYLYEDEFETENGLGKFRAVDHIEPDETPSEEYPFVLTTARIEQHFNTGSMSTRSDMLNRVAPENFVHIHPNDAEDQGIEDGDMVVLSSPRGEVELKAEVTDETKQGVLWSTFHFPDAPINRITNDALDPKAKIPEFKAASANAGEVGVDIEKVGSEAEPADD
ncbi:formate dehydrogenase subunit alpha [Salinarchaeum sp. IM2453]|uniref:formate dehydrogenase subunit alpha n=1 Tax=Salinarchaeum sp. IM2453 TaxID=2862870 RepID=UPI001C82CBFF|nr:formate dehydrogenase subunit alpha [Salinarchaeum sp. IM2453]QZA88636.1 formate dehydrogenase subunit alpha [Salinarchaeum sp. IM2453]